MSPVCSLSLLLATSSKCHVFVPGKARQKTLGSMGRMLSRKCSWDQHLERRREGSRVEQRERLGSPEEGPTKVSADPMESSGIRTVLQSFLKSRQGVRPLSSFFPPSVEGSDFG